MTDTRTLIRAFILTEFLPDESPGSVRDDTPLRTSGILDSFATMGVVGFIKERFGVELDVYDMSVERFDRIDDMAAVVAHKLAG